MPQFTTDPEDTWRDSSGSEDTWLLSSKAFNTFGSDLIGLGKLDVPSQQTEALCAIFDLAGFTRFCTQVDPHLAIPEFLSRFVDWLFVAIRDSCTERVESDGRVRLLVPLPFFAKFMGDGILFLWDVEGIPNRAVCQIPVLMLAVLERYQEEFLPLAQRPWDEPPSPLRCGVARGRVSSVGDGKDFVGPCINIAARLQKLTSHTFSFSRRGFDAERYLSNEQLVRFRLFVTPIRGIGPRERVFVLADEYSRLSEDEQKMFSVPD